MTGRPTVTALMAAFNEEAFVGEALDSALGQDYPAELLDVLVVDDGSTDGTVAIIEERAARHPGRVRLLRQANGGNGAALTKGLPEIRAELVAFLDADDAWPADKLRRQVEALPPRAGMLYGDMHLIDAAGETLEASWHAMIAAGDPPSGHCFGRLLAVGTATSSSILMRTELAQALGPIPAGVSPDWWLSLRAAQHAEVAYLAEPRTLYRFHGANQGLGSEGPVLGAAFRRRLRTQRWLMRTLEPGQVSPEELAAAWEAFERNATEAMRLGGSAFTETVDVDDDDREAARLLVAEAREHSRRGAHARALAAFARAAAHDPFCDDARAGLTRALPA